MLGAYITKIARTRRKRKIVTRSLKIKLGAIGSLSAFPVTPRGLFEPCSCSVRICITASAARMKGSTKWRLKNLFRVALLTLNPPQINSTRSPPTHGIALIRFVITVARLPINWIIVPQSKVPLLSLVSMISFARGERSFSSSSYFFGLRRRSIIKDNNNNLPPIQWPCTLSLLIQELLIEPCDSTPLLREHRLYIKPYTCP